MATACPSACTWPGHNRTLAEPTVQTIVLRTHGRPTTRPNKVAAGNTDGRRGSTPTMPPVAWHNRKQLKRGRQLRAGAGYRQCWNGERWFGWMDSCHRLVVRSDRHLRSSRACCLVAIILWCIDRMLK